MELVLRDKKAELCIDFDSGSIGFTMIDDNGNQYDFTATSEEWKQIENFIDNQIDDYELEQRKAKNNL